MTLNLLCELLARKKNKIARHCRVCVWNFSREVKLVPALPWQYFGNIWIYSVELLLPLVFRMSICLFFLVLAEKVLFILQYNLSRGQRCPCHFLCQRSWMTCGKDINQGRLIYVPANIWDNLWHGDLVKTLVMRAPSLVCVSSCCFPIRIHGTFIIMNLAQNVLSVLYKCVCVCVSGKGTSQWRLPDICLNL